MQELRPRKPARVCRCAALHLLAITVCFTGCANPRGFEFDERSREDFRSGMTVAEVVDLTRQYPVLEPISGHWPPEAEWAARLAGWPAREYQPWNDPTLWISNASGLGKVTWSGPLVVAADVLTRPPPRNATVYYIQPNAIWFSFDLDERLQRWGHTLGDTVVEFPAD